MTRPGQALRTAPPPAGSAPEPRRLQTVDAVRGAVMILMALDHVRDFLHAAAMSASPTDLSRTTAAIFLTRWITHSCAPVFALTAGLGAFLWVQRSRAASQLSRFLLTRGLWLVLLELTALRFILYFDLRFQNRLVILSVIWMLGLCMIALAALVRLPYRWLAALGVVTIAGHNLLDPVAPARFGPAAWVWDILHQQAVFRFHGVSFLVGYPLVPWVAVMSAGYCLGPVFLWEPARRRRFLTRLGLALTLAFVLLRAVNHYGDPSRWSVQPSPLFTVLSYLNCTKYPPSLLFLLMTLGPALAAMAWLERVRLPPAHPLIVFGRTPFFYFVVHLAVIHALAVALGWLRYGNAPFLWIPAPSMGGPRQWFPAAYGYGLWAVYAAWLAVVLILYPVCRWYAGLKQRRKDWWLSYL